MAGLDNSQWRESKQRMQLWERESPDLEMSKHLPQAGEARMPGPTGERNRYRLVPLSRVLCLGPTAALARTQATLALGLGCGVLICCVADNVLEDWVAAKRRAGAPLELLNGVAVPELLAAVDALEAVCLSGQELRAMRKALADREGAIVRIITTTSPAINFFHERHVCNDTTRAGGNIELMGRLAR